MRIICRAILFIANGIHLTLVLFEKPNLRTSSSVRYSLYLLRHHCKPCKPQTCVAQIEIEKIKLLRYNDNQHCIYYKLIEKGEQNGNELQQTLEIVN